MILLIMQTYLHSENVTKTYFLRMNNIAFVRNIFIL